MSDKLTSKPFHVSGGAKIWELPGLKDLIVFGLLVVLFVNLVSSWVFKEEPMARSVIATVSLERMIEQSNDYFMQKGQDKHRASLNVAYLMDYIQDELKAVNRAGQYALIMDSKAVYFSQSADITAEVLAKAMSAAKKDMTAAGHLPGRRANALR